MSNKSKVMVVLAIALAVAVGMVNLHCLYQTARRKPSFQKPAAPGGVPDLTFRICLVPYVHVNVDFDYR